MKERATRERMMIQKRTRMVVTMWKAIRRRRERSQDEKASAACPYISLFPSDHAGLW
jgi:hypothetical protein